MLYVVLLQTNLLDSLRLHKMLSEIAIHDEKGFEALVDAAKKALAK